MGDFIDWQVPSSTVTWLERMPADLPVAMLIRHSVRPPLRAGEEGFTLPITDDGIRIARSLGQRISGRLRSLSASPVLRCVQTAVEIGVGAGTNLPTQPDTTLGHPGIYVLDGELAYRNWEKSDHESVMAKLVSADHALPGMTLPEFAARYLVHHMLAKARGSPGLHVFVTHDSLVTATVARLAGVCLGKRDWPWYLEAAFFWRDCEGLHTVYREYRRTRGEAQLVGLNETDVIEFAKWDLTPIVGSECPARFFFAGGAFKALLNGRRPRDLDLWAPSPEDRAALIKTLVERGAVVLPERAYSEAFRIGNRVLEIQRKTEPGTLEARLARFDIGLSAVGVEHRPDSYWRAVIEPLAIESVERREILLLKPLTNWKHVLSTIGRMRKYAADLCYTLPPDEEANAWRVFEQQDAEMQRGMLQRFDNAADQGWGVREEAICRLRR
ncbi:MAG: histidine phosphatase family protein [Deltaproteobacteria bacterium]|nr:histidine phosphatase family protein [Deltaproteobacteria bacterium]